MMRAMCVLASYENLQKADEASLLTRLPDAPAAWSWSQVAYDPYNEVDRDGDGDPHTERTIDLIDRDTAVLPEIEDLVRAMHHCTGTICKSDDREFRFSFKRDGREMLLSAARSGRAAHLANDSLAIPCPCRGDAGSSQPLWDDIGDGSIARAGRRSRDVRRHRPRAGVQAARR